MAKTAASNSDATSVQTLSNKTLTTPTIADFTNSTHNHSNAAGGGTVAHSALTSLTTGDPHTQYLEISGARTGDQTYSLTGTSASKVVLRGNSVDATSKMVSRDFWSIGSFAESLVNSTSAIGIVVANGGAALTTTTTDIITTTTLMAPQGNFAATTNATVTTLGTIATTSNVYYAITSTILARDITNAKGGMYKRYACFRNDAGTVTQVGATTVLGTDLENIAGWDATIDFSGTSIRLRVTGAAATNIKWAGWTEVQTIS